MNEKIKDKLPFWNKLSEIEQNIIERECKVIRFDKE